MIEVNIQYYRYNILYNKVGDRVLGKFFLPSQHPNQGEKGRQETVDKEETRRSDGRSSADQNPR